MLTSHMHGAREPSWSPQLPTKRMSAYAVPRVWSAPMSLPCPLFLIFRNSKNFIIGIYLWCIIITTILGNWYTHTHHLLILFTSSPPPDSPFSPYSQVPFPSPHTLPSCFYRLSLFCSLNYSWETMWYLTSVSDLFHLLLWIDQRPHPLLNPYSVIWSSDKPNNNRSKDVHAWNPGTCESVIHKEKRLYL